MNQAVILAGGVGSRLMPITRHIPKPLVPVDGVPIIELQIRQLARLGVKQVIVLTGYKASFVEKFCAKLSLDIGLDIITSRMAEEVEPAARILEVANLLNDEFLLLYCDNYVPDDTLVRKSLTSIESTTFIVQSRTIGNVKFSNEVAYYKEGDRSLDYGFVELGYIKSKKDILLGSLKHHKTLPGALEEISQTSGIYGIELTSDYISVSNLDRFLASNTNNRYLLLDRDGVINKKMPPRIYVTNQSQFEFIEENVAALGELAKNGIQFIVATNQPAITLGLIDKKALEAIHQNMIEKLFFKGIYILAIYVCDHSWSDNCDCRKPKPGMLLSALATFKLNSNSTLYIGDEEKDRTAAKLANVECLLVRESSGHMGDSLSLKECLEKIYELLNYNR